MSRLGSPAVLMVCWRGGCGPAGVEEVERVVQQVRRLLVVPLLEEEVIEVGALFSWSWSSSSPQGLVEVFWGGSGEMFTPLFLERSLWKSEMLFIHSDYS